VPTMLAKLPVVLLVALLEAVTALLHCVDLFGKIVVKKQKLV